MFVQSERRRLIRGNKINPEEPALIRSRIGMARHIRNAERHLKDIEEEDLSVGTLFGDAEEEDGILLPDYYYPQACVPDIPWRTVWANDGDDDEVEMPDERVRLAPRGIFLPPKSSLAGKIDENIKQIQETRNLCAKIGVVKQMQVQTQVRQDRSS